MISPETRNRVNQLKRLLAETVIESEGTSPIAQLGAASALGVILTCKHGPCVCSACLFDASDILAAAERGLMDGVLA